MKKTILTLTVLSLSLTFTACSDNKPPQSKKQVTKKPSASQNEDLVFLPVTLSDIKKAEIQNALKTSDEEAEEKVTTAIKQIPVSNEKVNTSPVADTKTDTENNQTNADVDIKEVQLKMGDSFSTTELKNRYPSPIYKSFKFDVNSDGKRDYIIANDRYKDGKKQHRGDGLFVFLADKANQYKLDLISINFDTEGGLAFSGIMPRANNNGFILTTTLPDKVNHTRVQDYMFSKARGKWRINEFVSKAKTVKGDRYYCKEQVNYNATDDTGNFHPDKNMTPTQVLKNCPLPPLKYRVTAKKAEIFNDRFLHNKPATYFIKDDIFEQNDIYFEQNVDWVRTSYKDGNKTGWVKRDDLERAVLIQGVDKKNDSTNVKKYEIISDKAEIFTEDFTPNKPPNYFVKGDIIEEESIHFNKNLDWVYITYKDGKKMGWVIKDDLKEVE